MAPTPAPPRAVPAEAQLVRVRRLQELADLLDASFQVPGTSWRFGLDPLLGLIPGVGDAVSGVASLYIVFQSWRLGVGMGTLMRMLGNMLVDTVVGAIPLLGDVLDFAMKPNQRNLQLLRKELGIFDA